jgi:hypothetical protein
MKKMHRNSSVEGINKKNEIWPKQMKNKYLIKENKIREEKNSIERNSQKSSFEKQEDDENEDFFN